MIVFDNITYKAKNKTVLKNFSIEIGDNELIHLTGDSGAGKTTFIKLLQGFIIADKGKIIVDNKRITPENIKEIRRNISYLPQATPNFDGSCNDLIRKISVIKSIDYKNFHKEVYKNLNQLKLNYSDLEKSFSELSGGETQRTMIAITLAINSKIVILDEVFKGLDSRLKKITEELIINQSEKTIILISHQENIDIKFRKVSVES